MRAERRGSFRSRPGFILVSAGYAIGAGNIWKDLYLIGARDVLDSEDFLVSNLLLPIGSLVYLLFCVTRWEWGFDKYLEECNTGSGLKMSAKLKPYFSVCAAGDDTFDFGGGAQVKWGSPAHGFYVAQGSLCYVRNFILDSVRPRFQLPSRDSRDCKRSSR